MTRIFCLKDLSTGECLMFMSLAGMASWIKEKEPVNGILYEGKNYEVTAENMSAILEHSKSNYDLCPKITITESFFVQNIETDYILSTINVHE